jgi:hypothetical protein
LNAAKPSAVVYAERSLWVWAAWIALYGGYQTLIAAPDPDQTLQTVLGVPSDSLRSLTAAAYALAAASVVTLSLQIANGKRWARAMLLISFVLQALWDVGGTGSGILSHVADLPDLVLQAYALTMLYAAPSRQWFAAVRAAKR